MKNKRIDHIRKIMSKPHGIFTKHFTVFKCRKAGNVLVLLEIKTPQS